MNINILYDGSQWQIHRHIDRNQTTNAIGGSSLITPDSFIGKYIVLSDALDHCRRHDMKIRIVSSDGHQVQRESILRQG
jgi:hypothetical protein